MAGRETMSFVEVRLVEEDSTPKDKTEVAPPDARETLKLAIDRR